MTRNTLVVIGCSVAALAPIRAQTPQGNARYLLSPALQTLQSAPLQTLVARVPAKDSAYARTLATSSDTNARATAGNRIASDSAALDFTLAVLLHERNATVMRLTMLNLYYFRWAWSDPRVLDALRYVIATHPEPDAVAEALQQYRSITMRWLETTLTERVADAKRSGNDSLARALAPVQDRAVNLERGLMLPTFLRRAPPVFEEPVKNRATIRVLAFGDYGTASEGQKRAAAAMRAYHAKHPFDLGITLGDNFYTYGLATPTDPRWTSEFDDLYGPMGIDFFPSFGNHDEYEGDAPAAEIARTHSSTRWRFPAQFYTYTAGPAQFFALDTNDPSEVQLEWLREALDASKARWKIVYGHFPVFVSAGGIPGRSSYTTDSMMFERVMPVLRGRADVYVAGHHHSMQHLKAVDGVNLFVAGGGGASTYAVGTERDSRVLFAKQDNGFAVLEVTPTTFTVHFIDKDSRQIYEATIRK